MSVDDALRPLIDALADESRRADATQALARVLGAHRVLVYVEDPELHVLLPAPGMPKTLAAGASWREFLSLCARTARARGTVAMDGRTWHAAAVGANSGVLVAVAEREVTFPRALEDAMHLLGALLRVELALRLGKAEAEEARRSAVRAHELALALDSSRASAAELNRQLQVEHRRKDEFLAMLAHELRNPLAPITSAVEVLRRHGPDPQRTARLTDVMTRQLQQLTHLVDDLLDVSRVSRGLVELRCEVLSIDDVVAAAVESSRPQIDSRRHRLDIESPPVPLFVSGDRVRLVQVFSNVLNNAAKYTPPGGHLRVTTAAAGTEVRVRVTDNGAGIPREMLETIFEMFTQVPGSLDRAPGGLGIGLTLVRTLVDLHGGRVEAESPGPGAGSTFTVTLPLVPAPVATSSRPAAPAGPAPSIRVLIVDDNIDAAVTLGEVVRALGGQPRIAHDGAEALQVAAGFQPGLVLLDIGLPGMDGYETAREWRRRFGCGAKLVALTGYGSAEDRRRSAQAGFDQHVVKPIGAEAVAKLLLECTGVPSTKAEV